MNPFPLPQPTDESASRSSQARFSMVSHWAHLFTDTLFILPAVLIPLAFTTNNTNTIIIKETFYQFSILGWLLAWPLLDYLDRKEGRDPFTLAIPRSIWIGFALLLGGFFISAYLNSGLEKSKYEFFRWLTYITTSVITIFFLVQRRRLNLFLTATLATSGVVSVYALFQMIGADFFDWPLFEWESEKTRRVCSSLGNPDFLAGYLIGLIPLTLCLTFIKTGSLRKWMAFTLVLQMMAMIFSYSRGGWIATYLILILFMAAFIYLNWIYDPVLIPIRLSTKALFASLGLYLLMGLVALLLWWDQITVALFRLSKFSEGASITSRFLFYQGAWNMLMEHPLSGVGLGNFSQFFHAYRPQELSLFLSFKDFHLDHAHNEILEIAAETGLVGILLYGGLFLLVTGYVWKTLLTCRSRENLILLGLWMSLLGIQLHNLVTVTLRHTPTAYLYWALLGITVGYTALCHPPRKVTRSWLPRWIYLGIPLAVVALYSNASNYYVGDRYLRKGLDEIQAAAKAPTVGTIKKHLSAALIALHKGESHSPYREGAYFWKGLAYNRALDFPQGIAAYQTLEARHPNFPSTHMNIAVTYLKQMEFLARHKYTNLPKEAPQFEYLGRQCALEAIPWMERAMADEPSQPLYYRILGRCYYTLGELGKARNLFITGLQKAEGKQTEEMIETIADMQQYLQWINRIESQQAATQ